MDTASPPSVIDFEKNLRRSLGRNPRIISQNTKVTREEHRRLEATARKQGLSLGEWSREVLLRAADGFEPDPTFTEIIAIRQLLNSTMRLLVTGKQLSNEEFSQELQNIRSKKHQAAIEMMQQYAVKGETR